MRFTALPILYEDIEIIFTHPHAETVAVKSFLSRLSQAPSRFHFAKRLHFIAPCLSVVEHDCPHDRHFSDSPYDVDEGRDCYNKMTRRILRVCKAIPKDSLQAFR